MSSPPGSLLELRTGTFAHLRRFADGHYLYAILDAYDSPSVPEKVKEIGADKGVCLFTGEAETRYWAHAPYLAAVDAGLLAWMVDIVWKAPWGVFILSKMPMDGLREHLRRFLMVRLPDGERWYFRYYDPRILPIYLSNCEPLELQQFFGPIRAFAIPNSGPEDISFLHFPTDNHQDEAWAKLPGDPPLVRPEQFEAVQKAVLGDFEERAMKFLIRTYPEQARMLGQNGLRELIQFGCLRAEHYKMVGEDERSQFIELMLLLGRDFESNCSWAQAILNNSQVPNQRERINILREAAQRVRAS
jgi:hypothetical protein